MNSPRCPACGHINIVGATLCDVCEAPLNQRYEDYRHTYTSPDYEVAAGGLSTNVPSPSFSGIGEVFRPTLAFYRKQFVLVGLLVLITTFPVVLLQYASVFVFSDEVLIGAATNVFESTPLLAVANALLGGILVLIGTSILGGALVYGVIEVQRNGSAKVGDCLRWGMRKLPGIFVGNILYMVVVGAGFLLLVIPGIIFSLMYALFVPIIAAEGCGVVEAFRRSVSQTRGYKGMLFLTYFLWLVLISAVSLAITSSFAFGTGAWAFSAFFLQTLIEQMLQSSSIVLTVFIYLGIRNLPTSRGVHATVSTVHGSGIER